MEKQLYIGEGFEGPGVNLAHINVRVGPRSGPAGQAFATALATPFSGHAPFVVIARPGVTTTVGYDMGAYQDAGGHSRKHIMDAIDGSLTRLGMDYVDVYMLHDFDVNTPVEETMRALDDIVRAGKARYIGVSVFSPFARGLLTCDPVSTRNQTDFFTAQIYGNAASREIAASVARVAVQRGVSAAQIAQAWVLGHTGVSSMPRSR